MLFPHMFALYCQSLDKTVRYWHAVYIVCMWYLRVWPNKSSEFDVLFLFCFIFLLIAVWDMSTIAGYTPQDNRGDFGPISPLPTILGNVSIILVVLKIILFDFPVVWGVLRVTDSARKRTAEAPRCWIFTIRNPDVWREPWGHHTLQEQKS